MDSSKAMASEVTVVAHGAPSSYHVASTTENSGFGTLPMASPVMVTSSERKKRGRPRKYKTDESSSRTFSQGPLSSSAPPATNKSYVEEKMSGLARPTNSEKKHRSKVGTEKLDDWVDCFTGSSFLPHVITVNPGEDISTKIMEFSLQGPRTVCVVSGNGSVSSVTIRHPSSSGGTLTCEGLFEIISFSGSFTPVEMPDSKFGRTGTMTISLSGADGRVVGGLIGGLTIAATPVKVFIASFLTGSPDVVKPKKQKTESAVGLDALGAPTNVQRNIQGPSCSTSENPANWGASKAAERSTADINISLHG